MSARSIRRSHERVLVKDRRRTVRRAKRASIAAGAALGATVMFAPAAEAATFEVNTLNDGLTDGCTADPDGCTLREAVEDADVAGGDDIVTFASDLSGTITLTEGQIEISSGDILTIIDPGPSEITVSGGDATRIFSITNGLLEVDQLALIDGNGSGGRGGAIYAGNESDLTLTDSSVTGSSASGDGGGVAIEEGELVVTDSVISGNTATDQGGGIYLNGTYQGKYGANAVIVDSEISGNTAGTAGGGLFGDKYTELEVVDSEFSSNTATNAEGGGISFSGTSAEISGSEISGNTASGTGGGIFIKYAEFELTNSTVSGNEASSGAGLELDGKYGFNGASLDALISQSTIDGNTAGFTGGGVHVNEINGAGGVFIGQSTISNNDAGELGGGLAIDEEIEGPFEINNSTISGNTAPLGGGVSIDEIYYEQQDQRREVPEGSEGSLMFSNDTIADNTATEQGGGIYLGVYSYYDDEANEFVELSSTVPLSSTIVADNAGGDLAKAVASDNGGFTLSYSLVETPGTAPVTQDPAGSSILGTDPQLGNLADNGGPTLTHLPAATSPAIDQGVDNETARDQRGERRSVDLEPDNNPPNDPTDIGSVEIQTGAPPPVEPETRPLTSEEIPSGCGLTLATAGLALGGTDGGQTIVGSDQDDVLRGFGGADTVIGKAGDDCLTGDDDIDTIRGKSGNDLGLGGDDVDFMKGNTGDDDFRGNGSADRIKLGAGNDTGAGGGGDDNVAAGNGEDEIKGNAGGDRLFGNDGNDEIKGGSGGDVIFGGGGVNDIDCGSGDDKVIVNGNKDDISANCETVKVRSGNKGK